MEDHILDATVILGASCVCKTIPMTAEVHKLGFMIGKGEVSLWNFDHLATRILPYIQEFTRFKVVTISSLHNSHVSAGNINHES
ncbi:hypothetical protein QL285_023646 [Trifolium repens]|nr:hypothetical protein QL285_023646 [Trifolium repens]